MATTRFRKRGNRERMAQSFDKEKITMKRAIGEVNVYDFIQEGREDTEIYPTLEKYGSIDVMKINRGKEEQLFQDFTDIQELDGYRGVLDYQKKAKEMFYSLPLEVRKEFNNDINKFTQNGHEYLKNKIDKYKAEDLAREMAQKQAEASVQKPTTGEVM